MIAGVKIMAETGIGNQTLFVGEGDNFKYGLVNLAGFLGESMKETIMYNACDENNWSNPAVAKQFGGQPYTASYACGQGGQSYQDYKCTAEDDAKAGGKMACDTDPNMMLRAHTQAVWYGAPPKLFCAPKSIVPKANKWNWGSPWCPQKGGYGYKTPFPDVMDNKTLLEYYSYVAKGGSCRDYEGIKAGGWNGCGAGGCANSPAPVFHRAGRTDVEGCCWWGRGVIQTTGICNFGKLNYYLGRRGHDEGRSVLYPDIDFCKDPEAICKPDSPPALKWIAGFFYWLNSVQSYNDKDGWNYMDHLKKWVDAGMNLDDKSYINACSGIVNRGCYNPPCGGNPMDGGAQRAANFAKVMQALKLGTSSIEAEVMWADAHHVNTTECGPDSPAEVCQKHSAPPAPPNGTPTCAEAGRSVLCQVACRSTCRGFHPGFKSDGCVDQSDCTDPAPWAKGSVCTC